MDMMVAVDLAEQPEAVLTRALPWAARLGAHIHLRAVSRMLWEPDEVFGGTETQALAQEWERRRRNEEHVLAQLADQIPDRHRGQHEILHGSAVHTLLGAGAQFDCMAVGTHGRTGLQRLFLGSVAEQVVRQSTLPVLVLPFASEPALEQGPMKIVVPVDAAEPSLSAALKIRSWLGDNAQLHVVYALADLRLSQEIGMAVTSDTPDTHPHRAWAQTRLWDALRDAGLEAAVHFVLALGNNPGQEIATFADAYQADAVVMPTHGRKGLGRVAFGSVTERVLRLAHAPLWVIR